MLVLWPATLGAWEALDDAGIRAALAGTVLIYDDGATQSFTADGRTTYDAGRETFGRWAARGGRYCSTWPPSDLWVCYDVAREGAAIRFTGPDGSESVGRHAAE